MSSRFPPKSEDMMVTTVRSRDNGVMRPAIAFHKRRSIGGLTQLSERRYAYITTDEFDEWAATFMGLPGLTPSRWSDDPQHKGIEDFDHMPGYREKFVKERGPRRDIIVLETEDQLMLFKMRWQDAD